MAGRCAAPGDSAAALDAATEAAIGWLVTLGSGEVQACERRSFERWLAAHPQHRQAWNALNQPLAQLLDPLRPAAAAASASASGLHTPAAAPPGRLMGDALARAEARTRRRRQVLLRGALGVGGVAVGAALLADRFAPLGGWSADLRTATGERRDFALPDGSTVTLDARSAADLHFAGGQRTVVLRQGALMAQAAPARHAPGGAPFIVRTAQGQVQALGTRFVVRQEVTHTQVGMLEHSVAITTPAGDRLQLDEGQSARFGGPGGIERTPQSPVAASAWQRGMLEAHDLPLGEVVQALRAYRPGFIRVSPQAAALRVYGTYALDDTDRALAALAETLPVQVRVYQRGWLVRIE
ncbi:FecR domain-containing protein [Paracidovorax wautersii]|uniref:Transmembrane sensor n=1 Tax=Paracidovorax wautersii TaxID=1177982 RepID=A0ABU1I7I1_9BURK|nr:FecR domain-containing protein [Paracidovorax wautersii]MDR6213180.1 transmembrane sensor [Paracidovorax wautersii]